MEKPLERARTFCAGSSKIIRRRPGPAAIRSIIVSAALSSCENLPANLRPGRTFQSYYLALCALFVIAAVLIRIRAAFNDLWMDEIWSVGLIRQLRSALVVFNSAQILPESTLAIGRNVFIERSPRTHFAPHLFRFFVCVIGLVLRPCV